MDIRRFGLGAAALLLPLGLLACEGGVTGTESQSGQAAVTLSRADATGAAAASSVYSVDPGLAPVSMDVISSIVVQVNRVQVHRAGGAGNGSGQGSGGGAWEDLDVEVQEVDLLTDLSGGASLTIAEGDLPAGEYDQVRLFVDGATIVFSEAQPVPGGSETITEAQLTIPSAGQTGIKIPGASLTVEAEDAATVDVEFDAGTSVKNITITGAGDVKMTPVLMAGAGGSTG